MNTKERRETVLRFLKDSCKPITGTELACRLNVSRQIIVGDIGILRAQGTEVYATPQGYMLPSKIDKVERKDMVATITCQHDDKKLQRELEIIVDNGGKVIDVIVEHPLYGEIRADLLLLSRREVNSFVARLQECGAGQLSLVTKGVHLHTIEVPNEEVLALIENELLQEGILKK